MCVRVHVDDYFLQFETSQNRMAWLDRPTCQFRSHTTDEMGLDQQERLMVTEEPFLRSWSWWLRYATSSYLIYAITVGRQNVFAKTKIENCVEVSGSD